MAIACFSIKNIRPWITLILGLSFYQGLCQVVSYDNGRAISVSIEKSNWAQLQVFKTADTIPIMGKVIESGTSLVFEPVIPFTPGVRYRVLYGQKNVFFDVDPPLALAPTLLGVYPPVDTLPENVLKFYLQFDQPMTGKDSYQYLQVCDSDGQPVSPFLVLSPELWDHENTTLTLWLDPGRIKSGLIRHQRFGKPLIAHELYTLQINKAWQSQQGMPLTECYTRNFYITAADRSSPDVDTWQVYTPLAHSSMPLVVDFGETLDHQLIRECFDIEAVEGKFTASSDDRSVQFHPTEVWKPGAYIIFIQSRLEDLAGNNLNRVFDRDLSKDTIHSSYEKYYLSFEIE